MNEPQKEFLTFQEVAARLGVCTLTARIWGKAKMFPVINLGYRTKRIPADAIDDLIKRRTKIAVKGR